jgi:hypothetical protein
VVGQWALIELSRAIEKQDQLRIEIASLGGTDPTWEQITSGLPYLDAVVHEVLRLHPPVTETTRVVSIHYSKYHSYPPLPHRQQKTISSPSRRP